MVAVCWPRWPTCPYMVKTFKNLILQNRGCLGAESLLKSSGGGGGGSTKVAKIMVVHWHLTFWPFYGKVKFASLCICMGKNIQKSYSPKPRMPCDWIFAYIIRNGKSTKVAKIIVIHWHLTFLQRGQVCFCMHLYGPHTFVWKNVNNFKWFFLCSLWANVAQISCGASFGRRMNDC